MQADDDGCGREVRVKRKISGRMHPAMCRDGKLRNRYFQTVEYSQSRWGWRRLPVGVTVPKTHITIIFVGVTDGCDHYRDESTKIFALYLSAQLFFSAEKLAADRNLRQLRFSMMNLQRYGYRYRRTWEFANETLTAGSRPEFRKILPSDLPSFFNSPKIRRNFVLLFFICTMFQRPWRSSTNHREITFRKRVGSSVCTFVLSFPWDPTVRSFLVYCFTRVSQASCPVTTASFRFLP